MTGLNILSHDLQIHLPVLEFIDSLTPMQGGTGQAIQPGHHQGVALPDIFQACL